MTARRAREFLLDGSKPTVQQTGHLVNGRVRSIRASIALDDGVTYAAGDTIFIGKRPKGSRYAGHRLTNDVSLGTSTVAIGIEGTSGKYRTAAVATAVDTPEAIAKAAQLAADPLAADEDMIATIAVATLPNTAGKFLVIETFYTYD